MLTQLRLEAAVAQRIFDSVINDVRIMLDHDLVHGDLSAFNILFFDDRPRLIDLPQSVDVRIAVDPWPLFYRDIENICQYFSRQGLILDPLQLAMDLWRDPRR